MKTKRVLMLVLAVIMLFTFAACNGSASFMSKNEIKNLVAQYSAEPKMVMTLEYTTSEEETFKLEITYKLLLEKLPITVVNFINLVEEGFYNEKIDSAGTTSMIFDSRINSTTNAWLCGNYTYTQPADTEKDAYYSVADKKDYTIIGEFYQNDWKYELTDEQIAEYEAEDLDPDKYDNNPDFSMFSLAMYHEKDATKFDTASTVFFMTTSALTTENHKNFAVFAEVESMKVYKKGSSTAIDEASTVISDVAYDFSKLTSTKSRDVHYKNDDGEDQTTSATLLQYLIRVVSIEMSGTADYSKLPKNYIIK